MKSAPVIDSSKDKALAHLPRLCSKAGFEIEETETAVVKPNLCGYYHPSIELLSEIIEYLNPHTEEVIIGETKSMGHEPDAQFESLGIADLKEKYDKVKTLDLSSDERIKIETPNPYVLEEITVPKIVKDTDLLVNVPKVGTHPTTNLTNALKNLFGLLPHRDKHGKYHPLGMDKVISDLSQVIKPSINITDAEERVLIGKDPLAVDIRACKYTEPDPHEVRHLELVAEVRGQKLDEMIEEMEIIMF